MVFLPYIDMNQPCVYKCLPSWTPLPSPSTSHPSGSSQWTGPEHPVSCIELGLAICFTYGNIHVSMLFFQIIPLSPSPIESKSLFFTSVSLLLSRMQGHHYHLLLYALVSWWRGMWDLIPWPGIKPGAPCVLATGPPGKSLLFVVVFDPPAWLMGS